MASWPGQQSGNFILNDWLIGFGLWRFILFFLLLRIASYLEKKIEKVKKNIEKLKKNKKKWKVWLQTMSVYFPSFKYVSNFAKRIDIFDCFSLPRRVLFKCYLTLSRQRRQNPLSPFTPPLPLFPAQTPVCVSVAPSVRYGELLETEPSCSQCYLSKHVEGLVHNLLISYDLLMSYNMFWSVFGLLAHGT